MTKTEALKILQGHTWCSHGDLNEEAHKIAIRALNTVIQQEARAERDLIDTDDILAWVKREVAKEGYKK